MGFLPSWLNPFDVLIVLAMLGGTALGFVRGLVRMALSVVVFYIALVLATAFHDNIGRYISYMSGLGRTASFGIGFLMILILTSVVLNFALRRAFRGTELPGLRQVDQLGGMAIGFFVTSLWVGFGILVVAYMLGAPITEETTGMRLNMINYFEQSALIPIFYGFLPIALATLQPWMPGGLLPDILSTNL